MHGMIPWPMCDKLVRRTVTFDGRQSGIAIDNRFWHHLDRMAKEQRVKIDDLVRRICKPMRRQSGRAGLLRLAVLADLESRITDYNSLYRRQSGAAAMPARPDPTITPDGREPMMEK